MEKKPIKNIKMYSTSWCGDCHRAKFYLDKEEIEYEEIDIEENSEAAKRVEEINDGNRSVPTIIFEYEDGDTGIVVEPSNEELQQMIYESK